jgi:hypothetical protein
MRVLTQEMVDSSLKWYNECDDEYVKHLGGRLQYTHPEAASFTLALPPKIEQLPYFVRLLGTLCYEEGHFRGAMIWFTDTGIWDEFLEGIGYQILESMNTAAGQPMSFGAARGYRFRADELVKSLGMLMQPMIFGWDAYYLPMWNWGGCSEYFLEVSHHSCVDVHTKSKHFHDKAIESLANGQWDFYSHPDGKISRYINKSELLEMRKPDANSPTNL